MSASKTNPVDIHLAASRKAARESVQQLRAAIQAARGEERIRLRKEVLEELLGAIAYLEWDPPRPRPSARRAAIDPGEVRT